jgi:hypothetical protein
MSVKISFICSFLSKQKYIRNTPSTDSPENTNILTASISKHDGTQKLLCKFIGTQFWHTNKSKHNSIRRAVMKTVWRWWRWSIRIETCSGERSTWTKVKTVILVHVEFDSLAVHTTRRIHSWHQPISGSATTDCLPDNRLYRAKVTTDANFTAH